MSEHAFHDDQRVQTRADSPYREAGTTTGTIKRLGRTRHVVWFDNGLQILVHPEDLEPVMDTAAMPI